ncbi:FimV/HubP family polar landmark protein [Pseudomonas agarici]|uniref:FimV/HubP family polar landmark protein n=1 Tax=Pseudomonas agarici TaxID=46677 RepID=UPI000382CCF5|nr:FimV C-terminal domain-containing protein [Pseudomonas agarici]
MLESLQSVLRCSTEKSPVTKMRLCWMVIALVSLLHSALTSAMGLGDITLHSALNQPLNAQIALVDPGELAEGELSVSLATPEEFSQAGVERVFFLNDLRFTTILRGNRSVIQVQSNKPVTEPFLNFLVQVNRPNGRLLREYTVLLDPPGSSSVYNLPARGAALEPQAPLADIAPPAAAQGKRYTVVKGDSVWIIAKRLQAGGQTSVDEMFQGIRALNPGSEQLTVGQSLLLPDVAVVPGAPSPTAAPNLAVPATDTAGNAEQLAAASLENQQLQKTAEQLRARLEAQDEQISRDQKQMGDLRAQLAELKARAAAVPVTAPAPVVAPPVVAQQSGEFSLPLLVALALLVLLLAGALIVRRRRRLAQMAVEPAPVAPVGQDTPMVSQMVPAAAPVVVSASATRIEPVAEALATVRRETNEVPDALEGVSIYIAYGRFSEAAGILREAMLKEPQRTDLRLRLLDMLALQGDSAGYALEEQSLLASGFSEATLRELRSKYPKLQAASVSPVVVTSEPAPTPASSGVPMVPVAAPVLAAEWMEAVPKAEAKPLEDEFQLNLDDLSMDADWDLAGSFGDAPRQGNKAALDSSVLSGTDPVSTSHLDELPEVFEMPEEQFLCDFAEPEPELFAETDLSLPLTGDASDDEFLEHFMDDAQPLDIEPLEVDFASLEREQACASKLEQAQACITIGELDNASQLLHELLREADEPLKQVARTLLASIR